MASIAPLSEFNETNAELAAGIWPKLPTHRYHVYESKSVRPL